MNSLFGPCYYMAKTIRCLFGVMSMIALWQWQPSQEVLPWAALWFWVALAIFQSVENVSLEQYNKWNEYIGART